MPFVEINVKNEIEKQRQNNPEFKKAWDESRAAPSRPIPTTCIATPTKAI